MIFQSAFWMKNASLFFFFLPGCCFEQRMTLFALAPFPDQLPKRFQSRIADFSLVKKTKQTRVEMMGLAFALGVL